MSRQDVLASKEAAALKAEARARREKRYRELHAEGLDDRQIAESMSVGRKVVLRWRQLAGLAANAGGRK